MRCLGFSFLVGMVFLLTAPSAARAGLYHPDWLIVEEIDEQGYAQPLGADNFWLAYMRARDVSAKIVGGAMTSARLETEEEVKQLRAKAMRSPNDVAKLSADLILLNDPSFVTEALNLLRKEDTDEFINAAHQARAYQALPGMIFKAKDIEDSAVKDCKFPEKLFHMNKRQLIWYHQLENDYYLPWLENRAREAQRLEAIGRGSANVNDETLDPLFPKPTHPKTVVVPFGAKGGTPSGEASEKAKLPADAVAVVQQMMLWNPWDYRLAWMLAELYVAEGEYEFAERLLDNCRQSGYSPNELSQQREAIQPRVEAMRAEKRAKRVAEADRSVAEQQLERDREHRERMNKIYVVSATAILLGVLAYLQTREIIRRAMNRKNARSR